MAINAGGSFTAQSGSTVNVSGGWINYAGATVQTTQLLSDGQIIDISQASPDIVYSGLYDGTTLISRKWGTSQNYTNPILTGTQYNPGYIQGGNGGSLAITAPSMTVNGSFYGNTVAGSNQRTPASQLETTYAGASFLPTVLATQAVPTAGSLTLTFQGHNAAISGAPAYSPTPPVIDFGTSQSAGDLVLSPDLVNVDGFGVLSIKNADGTINVPCRREPLHLRGRVNFVQRGESRHRGKRERTRRQPELQRLRLFALCRCQLARYRHCPAEHARGRSDARTFRARSERNLEHGGLVIDDRASVGHGQHAARWRRMEGRLPSTASGSISRRAA